jgi:hypothetical protein
MNGVDLLSRAAIVLQDVEHKRWPLAELVGWINDGQSALVAIKPSANAKSVALAMQTGTLQALNDPTHFMLLRLPRNIASLGPPRVGGRAIRPVDRETLDASQPMWHDRATVPFRREVRQYIFDEENPSEFYVYPGNDGSGLVEAIVSVLPAALTATGDPTSINSYSATLALSDPYPLIVLDYVLSRAFSKDDIGADPGRAAAHMGAFMSALGAKAQAETTQSPNVRAKVGST